VHKPALFGCCLRAIGCFLTFLSFCYVNRGICISIGNGLRNGL
jgi:hypothetical protein